MSAIPIDRFVSFLEEDPEQGCWLWTGSLLPPCKANIGGYGRFRDGKGKLVSTHRWAYQYFREPIPVGLTLDHLCRVRRCANPWHLEAVTFAENIRRGRNWQSEKTHCPRGHSLSDAYVLQRDGYKERRCRLCHRDYARHWDKVRRGK